MHVNVRLNGGFSVGGWWNKGSQAHLDAGLKHALMPSENFHPKKPSLFARSLNMLVGEPSANLQATPPAPDEKRPNSVPNKDEGPKPKDPTGEDNAGGHHLPVRTLP